MDLPSFSRRVDRVFGSLHPPPSSSSSSSSIACWSASDQQMPFKQWNNRERIPARDDALCASHYEERGRLETPGGSLASRKQQCIWNDDLDCGEEEEEEADHMDVDDEENGSGEMVAEDSGNVFDPEEEAREMRMMVGLDSALDLEDEEDEFDKFAVGRARTGERIYMREVRGSADSFSVLPMCYSEFRSASTDPRANHGPAKARLEEDAREATTCTASRILQSTEGEQNRMSELENLTARLSSCEQGEDSGVGIEKPSVGEKRQISDVETHFSELGPSSALRGSAQILAEGKPTKRVRFALNNSQEILEPQGTSASVRPETFRKIEQKCAVPDHVINPSNYIHYALDCPNVNDDKSDSESFRQFLSGIITHSEQEQERKELPEKIEFVPRRRESCNANMDSNRLPSDGNAVGNAATEAALTRPIGIAAGYSIEEHEHNVVLITSTNNSDKTEASSVAEVSTEEKLSRMSRKYRARVVTNEEDDEMET